MRHWILFLSTILVLFISADQAAALEPGAFDFESGQWMGGPQSTLQADTLVFHGGALSARIQRDAESEGAFSALSFRVPADWDGETIELRGWLKSEEVAGWFGMWFRQDGKSGMVGFDNMQSRNLRGTTEWTQYSIKLPLNQGAHTHVVGALMAGTGTLWADDFSLWIDGKPLAEAPAVVREPTVLDTDTEFATGSGLDIRDLTSAQADHLTMLGQVWGFLKYHHPAVTVGQYQWDFELFRVLPRILAASDREDAQRELNNWIEGLGSWEPCEPCAQPAVDPAQAANTDWLNDTELLGAELSGRLKAVYAARPANEEQFWVDLFPRVGNPDFSREMAYGNLNELDAGYRLLSLYRFWSIIEYWCPNRDIIGENWADVLREFVAPIALSNEARSYQREMFKLVARVNDTHINLTGADKVKPPEGLAQVPVAMRWIEEQPVVAGWRHLPGGPGTGLQIGDVVLAVDGRPAANLMAELAPYYSASNDPHRAKQLATAMLKGPLGPCQLRVMRGDKEIDLTVDRMDYTMFDHSLHRWHTLPGRTYRLLAPGVAYLALEGVKRDSVSTWIEDALAHDAQGLVIDCRAYPGDFPIFKLGGHLVSEATPFVAFTVADKNNPGAFVWRKYATLLDPIAPHFSKPVVILVDEISLSSAEYHALAFRAAPQAIVMGSTTAGADGNISRLVLPGGLSLAISGIGIFDAEQGPTQRVGIVPDAVRKPTVAGIRAGRDEVLEAAVEHILGRPARESEVSSW